MIYNPIQIIKYTNILDHSISICMAHKSNRWPSDIHVTWDSGMVTLSFGSMGTLIGDTYLVWVILRIIMDSCPYLSIYLYIHIYIISKGSLISCEYNRQTTIIINHAYMCIYILLYINIYYCILIYIVILLYILNYILYIYHMYHISI